MQLAARAKRRNDRFMMSPQELLFFEMSQARRVRTVQPVAALASGGDSRKEQGGTAWRCNNGMVQYLGYCSYWRKRFEAFFGSYISKHEWMACSRNHPWFDSNGSTFR
jgi:hypothetical protein